MALIGGRGGRAEGAGCFSSSPALALAAAPPGPCPAPQLPGGLGRGWEQELMDSSRF